ncbi:hypothetical protein OESDEN_20820 [Oesophagostomum dentatum]|uniref:Uncharacterized protein n=1 Tax=Oesophagostomum dentatum TaxID=61180 RepID=A0A0B1S6L4_OESDE|nr:hypothetical protein OESDEN_20820 [Oesophagostomum dentatum]
MYAMNVANELMVPYASAVVMEIYREDSDYLVEFFYRNETTHSPYRLTLPKCGTRCTVQNMAEQYSDMTLASLGEQQQLCGTPLKDCNGSASIVSISFITVLLIVVNLL